MGLSVLLAPEPGAEPAPEPAAEPGPDPAPDPGPDPAAEPCPEPGAEPGAEPLAVSPTGGEPARAAPPSTDSVSERSEEVASERRLRCQARRGQRSARR